MVESISIADLAVIDKARIDFAPGLNVLTGETGAGKSVAIEALSLALGARASASAVRDGAKEARVEAVFRVEGRALEALDAILEESGIDRCEDGVLLVRRTVQASGGGRIWMNGCAATAATLKKAGALLADVHGPQSNNLLLDGRFRREALDAYGGVSTSACAASWERLAGIRAAIRDIDENEISPDGLDLLRHQVSELEDAALTEDDETLAERHAAAAHAGDVLAAAGEFTEILGGDGGAEDALSRALQPARSMARHLPQAESWIAELESIQVAVDELSRTVMDAASTMETDGEEFERMDARLGVISRLKRKYLRSGDNSVKALMDVAAGKRARLDAAESAGERRAELVAREKEELEIFGKAAKELSKARAKAAAKLSKDITEALRGLAFLQSRFTVEVSPGEPGPDGADKVDFLFEPNPGESARPLDDIASSGEIARAMLAVKGVLADHSGPSTLVFDEIDANIGGEAGRAVGERMRALAAHRQVVAITHLPQSAVYADRHVAVSKSAEGGRTRSSIRIVEGDGRIEEISRMLGGKGGDAAFVHAKELVAKAGRR